MRTSVTTGDIQRARRLRRDMTGSEKKLWAKLKAHRMADEHFRRQSPIGPYVVDFVSHGARLVVEVDGDQHGFDEGRKHDAVRDRYLANKGYDVLRFTNGDVQAEIDSVLMTIEAAVQRRLPTERYSARRSPSACTDLSPPPQRGRVGRGIDF